MLSHVTLTQGGEWDPAVLDHGLTDNDNWVSKAKREDDQECDSPFDKRGEHKHEEPVKAGVQIDNPTGPHSENPDDIEVNFHAADATVQAHQECKEASNLNKIFDYEGEGMPDNEVETVEEDDGNKENMETNTPPAETKSKPIDYSKRRPHFLHVPVKKIRKTFTDATKNAASIVCGPKANQTCKSPNPALNINRRNAPAATDSLFADAPAVDAPGCTGAQMFVGRKHCSLLVVASALSANSLMFFLITSENGEQWTC